MLGSLMVSHVRITSGILCTQQYNSQQDIIMSVIHLPLLSHHSVTGVSKNTVAGFV